MPKNSESHNDLPRQTDALRAPLRVTHDLCAVTDEKDHSRTDPPRLTDRQALPSGILFGAICRVGDLS